MKRMEPLPETGARRVSGRIGSLGPLFTSSLKNTGEDADPWTEMFPAMALFFGRVAQMYEPP